MGIRSGFKKAWTSPVVRSLDIKRDTFSGSGLGGEKKSKTGGPPIKT